MISYPENCVQIEYFPVRSAVVIAKTKNAHHFAILHDAVKRIRNERGKSEFTLDVETAIETCESFQRNFVTQQWEELLKFFTRFI
jgi:hypothetical protein